MTQAEPTSSRLADIGWVAARITGALVILSQSAGHLLLIPTNPMLLGIGALGLFGREAKEYLQLMFGRGTGSGPS